MHKQIAITCATFVLLSAMVCASDRLPGKPDESAEASSSGPIVVPVQDRSDHSVTCWLETSLQRVYPTSPAGSHRTLSLLTARNRHVSFQACLANRGSSPLDVGCTVTGATGCDVRVRRVGYVPQWHATIDTPVEELDGAGHVPGLVPDPLFPETTVRMGPYENQSFWITITVPADVAPGVRDLAVNLALHHGAQLIELHATLDIRPLVVEPRRDFPVTHWWRPETIYEHYDIEPFGEQWWKLAEAYIRNLVAHGNNVIFVQQLFPR
ncbi:MAG: glycoside hydrolase domain-containing protein, partial [Pirellulaceae bacterium]